MKISLDQLSKRFQKHWIFKDISYNFNNSGSYALLGANGSGKSTLLRIIAGLQSPSKGTIKYEVDGKPLPANAVFPYISFCAPGMEIIEELTLPEFLQFHFAFKKLLPGLDITQIIALCGLQQSVHKPIADFSSGMKQRVKLAQAFFSDTPLILLDEPCTNLDQKGVEQYEHWVEQYTKNRLLIVASNDPKEYYFCKERLEIEDFK